MPRLLSARALSRCLSRRTLGGAVALAIAGLLLASLSASPAAAQPKPVVLIRTDPTSPGASTTPRVFGRVEGQVVTLATGPALVVRQSVLSGPEVVIYADPGCSGEVLAAGSPEELENIGIEVTVAAGSTTELYARQIEGGEGSSCSAGISYRQADGSQGEPGEPADPPGEPADPPEEPGQPGAGGPSGGSDPAPPPAAGGGLAPPAPGSSAPTSQSSTPTPAQGARDSQPPLTRITFGPGVKTRKRSVVFRFADISDDPPGTAFFCRLDRRRWHRCRAPWRLSHLSLRVHFVRVRAVDAAGNVEPVAAKRRFKVVGRRR